MLTRQINSDAILAGARIAPVICGVMHKEEVMPHPQESNSSPVDITFTFYHINLQRSAKWS